MYMAILAERIRDNSERKKAIPHNLTGFRKRMGTIDNIGAKLFDKYIIRKRKESYSNVRELEGSV